MAGSRATEVRRATRQNPGRAQVSKAISIPAPTGGGDAVSPLANMAAENALILDNFICRPGYAELRRGYIQQVSGFAAPVQSLLVYRGAAAGDKLLACAGGNIYDATTQGEALPAPLYTAATVATWQAVSFANPAGSWLIACNGVDAPISYNGAVVAALAMSSAAGAAYTLNPNKLLSVTAYVGRLYFIEAGSLRVWYPAAGAIGGTMTVLDLGSVFTKGGRLIACATWSLQDSTGVLQYLCFLTDQGQIALYQGTDPEQASLFALVALVDLGLPLGPRALVSYGSDLVVLTADGAVPLSQAMKLDRSQDDLVAVTQRIQNAFAQAARAYRGNFGWEAILYSGGVETAASNLEEGGGSLIIVNVPTTALQTSVQFVQNVQTGAWSRFLGIDSFCWAIANQAIYFGRAAAVYQWDIGADDNGAVITGEVKMAFNACGSRAQSKLFTMIRPLLYCSALIQPALDIDVDYQNSTPTSVPVIVDPGSTTPETRYDWTTVGGVGYVGAVHMTVSVKGDKTPEVLQDGAGDAIAVGDGSELLTNSNLPFDVPFQLIGFDLIYQPGGQL